MMKKIIISGALLLVTALTVYYISIVSDHREDQNDTLDESNHAGGSIHSKNASPSPAANALRVKERPPEDLNEKYEKHIVSRTKFLKFVEFKEPNFHSLIQKNSQEFFTRKINHRIPVNTLEDAFSQLDEIVSIAYRIRCPHSYYIDKGWLYIWGGHSNEPKHGCAIEMNSGKFHTWHTYTEKSDTRYFRNLSSYFFTLDQLKEITGN